MEDVPKLVKIPKSECPDIRTRQPEHKLSEFLSSMEDTVVPFGRNVHGHTWAGLLRERQFEKPLLKYCWESSKLWMFIFEPRKRAVLICVCGQYQTDWEKAEH